MRTSRKPGLSALMRWVAPAGLAVAMVVAPLTLPVAQADTDYGGGCVLYDGDRAATVDSLRFRCNPAQQDAIFRDASPGAVPMGVKNGWVIRPIDMRAWTPAVWIGKTFYTGPDGGRVLNRITAAGIEGWPADVYRGPALLDGGPSWVLDYRPSPSPQLYDEIREITPGVWFGYSWSREAAGPAQLLSFALA
ncbi:hypothetical protein GCM10027088_44270 [Nocardia goodfellowii]